MQAGCEKLKMSHEDCQLVLEEDGTEIDEDVDIMELAGSTFILLAKGQSWSKASRDDATSVPVPEPEPTKPPASSEHSQTPKGNTSKTSQKQMCI